MRKEKLSEKIKLEYDLYSTDYVYRIEHVYDLFDVLTEDNMQEVYRLGMFSLEKHYQNSVYMTGSRKILECDGVHYATMIIMFPLDEAGIQDFFDRELDRIKNKSTLEYVKHRR